MSYSRWGSSYWYTFWRAIKHPENHNNATFEICGVTSFAAAQIRKDVARCVDTSVAMIPPQNKPPTESDKKELRKLMLQFLADVDAKYPRKGGCK